MSKTNELFIEGILESDFEFSHERKGVNYYYSVVSTKRISEVSDEINVILPENIKNEMDLKKGDCVNIKGEFRSNNFHHEENKKKLNLYAYVKEIIKIEEENKKDTNYIKMTGYICKAPVYRKTPKGRIITDLIVAVHRDYGVSDYIPCIVWGNNAKNAKDLNVGTKISISGRIQSRKYEKKLENGDILEKVAYEVSINTIENSKEES